MAFRFRDRTEAGRCLASKLSRYRDQPGVLVLALPRGGVPVAYEVAQALDAPLDVFIVRKLGLPGREEFAIGAIASGGVRVADHAALQAFGISPAQFDAITAREAAELERRERQYRNDSPPPDVRGRTTIVVDDGLATGQTMRAAVAALRQEGAGRIVVAAPVAAPETCDAMRGIADDVVCAEMPEPFYAVGLWYEDFSQTSDEEVEHLLALTRGRGSAAPPGRA